MTVAEMIAMLSQYPSDLPITIDGERNFLSPVSAQIEGDQEGFRPYLMINTEVD